MISVFARDGLSVDILSSLSFRSELGISLKKNLHYFDREALLKELNSARRWYMSSEILEQLPIDCRVKSSQSIVLKFDRYWPDHQVRKVFNDLLGFRSTVDSYDDVLRLDDRHLKVVDLTKGKAIDDGYRGVHVYFTLAPGYYPIEIQYNSYFDRQINNWLHKYVYKHCDDPEIGRGLRLCFERGQFHDESGFLRRLNDVLSGS